MRNKTALALGAICQCRIEQRLRSYSAVVVSTILVGLDTDDSDIDVVCHYVDQPQFIKDFESIFGMEEDYSLQLKNDHVIGRFRRQSFLFEVYASPVPVAQQAAYRHYRVMQRLVHLGGEILQANIRDLKFSGLKTEPAISYLLQLQGDPYQAVLELESWSDTDLKNRLASALRQH